jgi:transposase
MSRTLKCRISDRHSAQPADCKTQMAFPDHDLLLRLNSFCGRRSLDARHRRRLKAVQLLLQRPDRFHIEQRAHSSLRTVQRWARLVRQFGPEILSENRPRLMASKLSSDQRSRLMADLRRQPDGNTKGPSQWSGAALMRHVLQSYGIRLSARHCRRLLAELGIAKSRSMQRAVQKPTRSEAGHETVTACSRPMGDYDRKRRALVSIKRLASSGLPLQAFAYTLFDLVHEAVSYDEISPGLTVETRCGASWVTRNFDYGRWFPLMQKYVLEATPEISGLNPPSLLPCNPCTVLCHEQVARPDYHRSEGYNEFFRPLGMHHGLLTCCVMKGASSVTIRFFAVRR